MFYGLGFVDLSFGSGFLCTIQKQEKGGRGGKGEGGGRLDSLGELWLPGDRGPLTSDDKEVLQGPSNQRIWGLRKDIRA